MKLKIGYFADGPWSHRAFEKIIENQSIEIAFIVPRSDTKDLTLKNYADKYSIDYIKGVKVNSPEFITKVSSYNCDLLVSMSFNQIFRKEIINLTKYKIINCHAGKLPFYRGRNILNWALINNESEYGITVHFVDEGIDTGDIILQRSYPITIEDNYSTLLDRAHIDCADILYDAILLFLTNQVTRVKQNTIHEVGMYCGCRGEGDEIINWNQTSLNIFNFIRAVCIPGPQAQTSIENNSVRINKSRLIDDAPNYIGTPGQIIGKSDKGFYVKTKDSFIEIFDVSVENNGKLKVGGKLK